MQTVQQDNRVDMQLQLANWRILSIVVNKILHKKKHNIIHDYS